MDDPEPVVSFVMSAYDAAESIAESIDSALAQTEPAIEVIVVDDGSTDRTLEIAREKGRADRRVRVVSQPNAGAGAARDAGLRLARGRAIAFLDSDDLVPPEKVRVQAAILDQHPEIDVVYADCHELVPGPEGGWIAGPRRKSADDALVEILDVRAPFQLHSALFRAAAIREVGGFGDAPSHAEDLHLCARLALGGAHFCHVPDPRVFHGIRPGSRSRDDVGMARGRFEVGAWLLRNLSRDRREERRLLRIRVRWLAMDLGNLLAGAGRGIQARLAFLRTLRFGCGPGHLREVLGLLAAPDRGLVAQYRAHIRATHGLTAVRTGAVVDGEAATDRAASRGIGRLFPSRRARAEVAALSSRWPPIRDVAAQLGASRRMLRGDHRRYVRGVSNTQYALSLETSALLYALCRVCAPRRVLDLGSGFSSFILRRYQLDRSVEVVRSIDDQPPWLERTRRFLADRGCPTEGLFPLEALGPEDSGAWDIVCYDLGDIETRARLLPRALDCAKPGTGLVLIDDVHMDDYRAVVEAELERRSVEPLRTKELTLDVFGRHAWLVTGL